VGADLEAKFPQELLTSTPCIKVSNKTGSNAYQPANYVMQTLSGDPALRAKKDGSKVRGSSPFLPATHSAQSLLRARPLLRAKRSLLLCLARFAPAARAWKTAAVAVVGSGRRSNLIVWLACLLVCALCSVLCALCVQVELTPADTHWHSIVSHICGTYADWSVN
jgi:hypothetical protein